MSKKSEKVRALLLCQFEKLFTWCLYFFRFPAYWYLKLRFVSNIFLGQKSPKSAIVLGGRPIWNIKLPNFCQKRFPINNFTFHTEVHLFVTLVLTIRCTRQLDLYFGKILLLKQWRKFLQYPWSKRTLWKQWWETGRTPKYNCQYGYHKSF